MIQTRVRLFRRILDTAIQYDALFTFPREVRYCKAVSVSTCGTGHHRDEANSKPFVSLLYSRTIPRASIIRNGGKLFHEPRAGSSESLFASPERFPPKNSKNGHNAPIRYVLHAGCSIMPNRPVRVQWEYPRKVEQHYPIESGQPTKRNRALTIVYSFSEFPT